MKSPAPISPGDSAPSGNGVDFSEPEKLFSISDGVSTSLFSGSATSADMGCGAMSNAPVTLGAEAALNAFRAALRDKGLRRAVVHAAWTLVWVVWNFLRQATGDDAYERYLDHMARLHPGRPAMSRSGYYQFRTEQKWNRITRCC